MLHVFPGGRVQISDVQILGLLAELSLGKGLYDYHLYLLQRLQADGLQDEGKGSRAYYVGITGSLESRMIQHSQGHTRSTAPFQWELVAVVPVGSQQSALLVEKWMKCGRSRDKRLHVLKLYRSCVNPSDIGMYLIGLAEAWQMRRAAKQCMALIPGSISPSTPSEEATYNV